MRRYVTALLMIVAAILLVFNIVVASDALGSHSSTNSIRAEGDPLPLPPWPWPWPWKFAV